MNTRTLIVLALAGITAPAMAATIYVDAANCRPPVSDCCTAHGGPGCDDRPCETAVCAIQPACCDEWDSLCVSLAESLCDLCRGTTEQGISHG